MRAIRTWGSVRGVLGDRHPYRDLCGDSRWHGRRGGPADVEAEWTAPQRRRVNLDGPGSVLQDKWGACND